MSKIKDKWLESGGGLGLGSEGANRTAHTIVSDGGSANLKTFSSSNTISFKLRARVYIDATTDTYEEFNLDGLHIGSDWILAGDVVASTSVASGIEFSINSGGVLSYTLPVITGFSTGNIIYNVTTLDA